MSSLYIVLACLFWAFDSLIRYPLIQNGISAAQVVSFEHFFALFLFSLFFKKSYTKLFQRKYVVEFLFIGCFGSALATLAFSKAFQFMNPSVVIILQKLQPLVAITFAHLILKEKVVKGFLSWALVCLVGVVLISWKDFIVFSNEYSLQNMMGYFYTAVAVMGWGLATVFGRKLTLKGLNEREIIFGRFSFSLIVLVPLFLFQGSQWQYDLNLTKEILILVLISAILGMSFYYKGLKVTPAKQATILELFFPLFAVIINWVAFNQTLSLIQFIGAGALILGSTMIQLKKY